MPTIIRWAGAVPAGSVNQQLLSSLDWFATLSALAGYTPDPRVPSDSLDVLDSLLDPAAPSPRTLFHYYSTAVTEEDVTATKGATPPAAENGLALPRLMAVRDARFKLHMWTRGSHRPPTGRADWTYPDAGVCADGLRNWTAAPLLFDLLIDPGENVPRTPCEWDGTWPAPKGWHSGCMPRAEYADAVARLTAEYEAQLTRLPPVVPRPALGTASERFPCCSPGCSPLPHCCACAPGAEAGVAQPLELWASY